MCCLVQFYKNPPLLTASSLNWINFTRVLMVTWHIKQYICGCIFFLLSFAIYTTKLFPPPLPPSLPPYFLAAAIFPVVTSNDLLLSLFKKSATSFSVAATDSTSPPTTRLNAFSASSHAPA